MLIKNLRLKNYRNYDSLNLSFDPNLNIITGNNGKGKTNILESIVFISNTKSFRTNNDEDLIKKDCDVARIELFTQEKEYKAVINKKSKSLFINNDHIKKTSEFIGDLNAIVFKPGDLELFHQSPKERRKLMDVEIGKVSSEYLRSLLSYNKLLKDKNNLLKELEIDETLLSVIEESMVPLIRTIMEHRTRFFEIINSNITEIYRKISGSDSVIKIKYQRSCEPEEITDSINKSREKDFYYHYTTFGPHHEDYEFFYDGYELNSLASQGQKRMVFIAFKLSLVKYIQEIKKIMPIVLLDDILSELDTDNQKRLLEEIPKDTQVIITDTDIRHLNISNHYQLIEL